MNIITNYIDINWWSNTLTEYVLHPSIMITLCLLSVFVVLGNLLVVSAIWHEHQLHSVTNYLIASLAAADCLVGAVVMPFSIISEIIIGSWTFGETWCDLWHSFDVLASTASIMNLCAISLDRYLAITDPISYPSRMTPKRVALLIVSLWTCSSLISFPAILWWRAVGQSPLQQLLPPTTVTISPIELASIPSHVSFPEDLQFKCVFTDDPYYLLFSSFISFYGPLCVMLYAYYRIYKAAVQQTRFLKHGSKEVMIGRSKRKKAMRHLSEHSREGFNEKSRLNETSCTGLSEMESYDRQHLVLRVHRGGGGGGTNSSIRKSSNGDTGNMKNQSSVKKKANYRNVEMYSPKVSSYSCNETKTAIKVAQKTDNLDQTGTSKFQYPLNNTVSQISSSSWRNRSDLTSSKRDKSRVESQRFDSTPLDNQLCNKASLLEVLILPKTSNVKEEISVNNSMSELSQKEFRKNFIESSNKDSSPKGKPSQAFINSRSTTIDVSILNRSNQVKTGNQRVETSSNSIIRRFKSVNNSHNSLRDSSFIYNRDKVVLGKDDSCSLGRKRCDNVLGGESVSISSTGSGSGSSSSNSGSENSTSSSSSNSSSNSNSSYGTGSLASVIVRPQAKQKNTADRIHTKNHNCDTNENLQGTPRVRRALSFGEARHKELGSRKSRTDIHCSTGYDQLDILFRNKQRASLDGSSSKNSYTNSTSKTSIAMNIRSWVKLPRTKPRKHRACRDSVIIKPPPSLMPLIKMNSDISVDSSNAATNVIKPIDERRLKHINDEESSYELDLAEGNTEDKFEQNLQETKLGAKENIDAVEKQVDKNLTFKDLGREKGCNKHQMLYYDSDKLIQSIVDLNAISYIDCAKPNSKIDIKAIGCKAEAASDVEKMNLELSEQVQLTDNSRVNRPHRQHRSVGKKLSKLAKERKAAKTLGIVVGVFILCWLPFFVVNIVVALCGSNCIYKLQILVPIVTWLGWLNSAMNPVIYACWSRDFRRAFRRVLCSWVEFVCPYDGAYMATKLKLKKCSNYSGHDTYLSRNVSSIKGNTSSATVRSGMSMEGRGAQNGGVSRSLLILSEA